jgi:hypothetical protein
MGTLAVLLLTATWFNGAFALRHWGPVALLALVTAAASAWSGVLRVPRGAPQVAVGAIFVLAAWALLSAVWAESPSRALEGGARTLLYAVLFLMALATPRDAAGAARLSVLVMTGVGAIAGITLIELVFDGNGAFLAGRLDAPVGYRNATACLFALGFWPFVSAAARHGVAVPLRALAFAAALLVLGLALLTQSRGVVLGLALGGAVAVGLGPDRLRRLWVAIAAAGALALASGSLLVPYHAFADGRPESAADIETAVTALLVLVVGGFAVALAAALLDAGLRVGERTRRSLERAALAGAVAMVPVALIVTVAAVGNPVTFATDRFDEFRSLETVPAGETRLTFGGGQRSDLWRIALLELSANPVTGVGEGNYLFRYYEERRTDRNVSTPHGLAFSALAETGLVGALALLTFLLSAATTVARYWRGAAPEARRAASAMLAVAAVGFGQAMVDWLWLIPGLMGLAFVALGLALACLLPARDAGGGTPARSIITPRAAAVALALGALAVCSLYLSDVNIRRARAPDVSAADQLRAARLAHRLNPWSVTPLQLQAGAHEELGRPGRARRELGQALEREPANFALLALIGDFELRRGNAAAARGWYERALRRNPLDVGLQQLARRGLPEAR